MTKTAELVHGDFSTLAEDYATYRPGYAPVVLRAIAGLLDAPLDRVDFVDVGAGTEIWTRSVAALGCRSVVAVEPNDAMRTQGRNGNGSLSIVWQKGDGEATGLPDACCDLLTMASSFHWTDYSRAVAEFDRVIRPGGWFAALWNTRFIEANAVLVEIEAELKRLVPELKRVSSGRSEFCDGLTTRLRGDSPFNEVVCLEGYHTETMTPERYIGIWRSVNDVRFQAGPERFARFLDFVADRLKGSDCVEATYLTRAWAARRPPG